MKSLISDFNLLYPAFAAKELNGVDVDVFEHENKGKPGTLAKLVVQNVCGWEFSRAFLEQTKSFHSKAHNLPGFSRSNCHEIMAKECDGLLCTEDEEGITFHLFELKSNFGVEKVAEAKDQITGSYLKLRHLLAPLQGAQGKKISMVGYIVLYEPDSEQLTTIKTITDPRGAFCVRLLHQHSYTMPGHKCSAYWRPLVCPDLNFRMITVTKGRPDHTIKI